MRWVLVAMTLLLASVWSCTLFVSIRWTNGPKLGGVGIVQFSRGGLDVWAYHTNGQSYADSAKRISGEKTGWRIVYDGFGWPTWKLERGNAVEPSSGSLSPAVEWVSIPLWPVIAASLVTTAIPWTLFAWARVKAARRAAAGLCPACGYDRDHLAEGAPCPECGAVPAK